MGVTAVRSDLFQVTLSGRSYGMSKTFTTASCFFWNMLWASGARLELPEAARDNASLSSLFPEPGPLRAPKMAQSCSHSVILSGAIRDEKSPDSRISAAAVAIAPTATQVKPPPRLIL